MSLTNQSLKFKKIPPAIIVIVSDTRALVCWVDNDQYKKGNKCPHPLAILTQVSASSQTVLTTKLLQANWWSCCPAGDEICHL